MSIQEAAVAAAIERFQSAALGAGEWMGALEGLAALTGAKCGELIGLGADAAVPFNWMSGLPPEATREFLAAGGGDIRVNSRVRIGQRIEPLAVLDERAFNTEADGRRHPAYGEWVRRHEMNYICLTPLVRQDEMLVGLAVVRTERQGLIDDGARRAFATVAAHARAAVRTQMAIDGHGFDLLNGLLAALPNPSFVCDPSGRVRAMSDSAEALVAQDGALRLRNGQLTARADVDAAALRQALAVAAEIGDGDLRAPPRDVVLCGPDGVGRLRLEITTLPPDCRRFGVSVLVVAHVPHAREERTAELARLLYRLTPAESRVAAMMVSGRGPQAVAVELGVSVETVRTHIRQIYAKVGVSSHLELGATLWRI